MSSKDNKEKRKLLVRKCMAFRYTVEESLEFLKKNNFNIDERTLRRDKEELNKAYGEIVSDALRNELAVGMLDDVFSLEEIQKECWKLANDSKTSTSERIRLFNFLAKSLSNKFKLFHKMPFTLSKLKISTAEDEKSLQVRKITY